MRVEKQIMDNSEHNRITWSDDDWDLVAAELKRQNPTRNTSSYYRFDFSTMELEDAAEVVIPQERQRSFESFDLVRRPLFNAFERMKPNSRAVLKVVESVPRQDGKIVWTPEQWEAIVLELHSVDPTLFEKNCAHLGNRAIETAQEIFPVKDRRHFKQVVSLRIQLMKAWEQLQAAKRDARPPVVVDFESGPIMEPPARKSDNSSAIATAMHVAFQTGPVEKKPRKTKVYWKDEDWLAVAREMRRQNPHINFFASKFSIIDLPAVREAQRAVLPLERRKNLAGQKNLQEPLVAAFKALLVEVNAGNLTEQAPPVESGPLHIEPATLVQSSPIEQAKPAEVPEADMHEFSFNAAVLNAAVPLVNLMIDEIVKRLLPQLSDIIFPSLSKSINTMLESTLAGVTRAATPVAAIPAQVAPFTNLNQPQGSGRLSAKEISEFFPVPEAKPKKPKIVLLGPSGKQKTDIEHSYPEFRFVFIEHGHGIKEAAVDCELFIVYNSHMTTPNKAAVKAYVPFEKLRKLEGSLTSVKRQIHAWKANR